MAKLQFVNNDTVQPAVGDIVRSSGQNFGAVLAQADSEAHGQGILGVWADNPRPGYSGEVDIDSVVEVNCVVAVSPGDKLYLSAATAGKATNVAPTIPIYLGTALSVKVVGGAYKAVLYLLTDAVSPDAQIAAENLAAQQADGQTDLVPPRRPSRSSGAGCWLNSRPRYADRDE